MSEEHLASCRITTTIIYPTLRVSLVEQPRPPSGRWMTPSELGEYTYCPRAWWYSRQGIGRPAGQAREDQFDYGLQIQTNLQAAHLAASQLKGFPWGATVAILAAMLVGGLVLWTWFL